jgi:hypothetical protein
VDKINTPIVDLVVYHISIAGRPSFYRPLHLTGRATRANTKHYYDLLSSYPLLSQPPTGLLPCSPKYNRDSRVIFSTIVSTNSLCDDSVPAPHFMQATALSYKHQLTGLDAGSTILNTQQIVQLINNTNCLRSVTAATTLLQNREHMHGV